MSFKDKLFVVANEDMGIYPQACRQPGGHMKPRTPYQDGWNAYAMELLEKWCSLSKWFDALTPDQRGQVEALFSEDDSDQYGLSQDEGKVTLWCLMSDTFAYACADAENIPLEALPVVLRLREEFGYEGVTAWAANRRGEEPLKQLQTDKYKEALAVAREAGKGET